MHPNPVVYLLLREAQGTRQTGLGHGSGRARNSETGSDLDDLLNYSAYVANTLRQATGSVKNMGIQSGVRQAQIISSSAGYGYVDYNVGRYGAYGGYGASGTITTYDPVAEARGIYAERRVVKAEEKATMATDVQTLRQNLIAATTDIRRKMTQKYQVEF